MVAGAGAVAVCASVRAARPSTPRAGRPTPPPRAPRRHPTPSPPTMPPSLIETAEDDPRATAARYCVALAAGTVSVWGEGEWSVRSPCGGRDWGRAARRGAARPRPPPAWIGRDRAPLPRPPNAAR